MQINVSQLLREPIGSTRDYPVNEEIDISEGGDPHPVRGEIRLLRTQRSILAKCSLSTDIELVCSRCLSPFHHPLSVNFEEEYRPTVDADTGAPLPAPEDSNSFTIDEHHILDTTEATRQYALTAVPMKPLCRQDCPGLCPRCGHNLNNGECSCPAESSDPRWSKLARLLKK